MKKGHRTTGGVSVHVKGKNFTVSPEIYEQVTHKMSKLDKYLDRLHEIDVELCTEKTRDATHHNRVEATAHVLGRTIRVTSEDSDMYAAIDEAVDKLYRQLNRAKERIKAHHGEKLAEILPVEIETVLPPLEEGPSTTSPNGEPIIHLEQLEIKPQFEDEALDEMNALGHDFYVFLNAKNEHVNVLYRRGDGSYGLIEPVPS